MLKYKIAISVLCVLIFSQLFAQEYIREIIPNSYWIINDVDFCYIRFQKEKYIIGAQEGAGSFGEGTYKINNDQNIELSIPTFQNRELDIISNVKGWINKYWINDKLILKYDKNYADIHFSGCLRNNEDTIILISSKSSKNGSEVIQDNVKTIKEQKKYVVTENLIMRKLPNQKEINNLYSGEDILYQYNQLANKFSFEGKQYKIIENKTYKLFPKGYIINTQGRTVELSKIDGIKSPWMYYTFEVPGDFLYTGWVFGGYLEPYDELKEKDYYNIMVKNIIEMKWVVLAE